MRHLTIRWSLVVLLCLGVLGIQSQSIRTYAQTDTDFYIIAVAWSPDGTRLAAVGLQPSASQGYIHVLDAETGTTYYLATPLSAGFKSVAWSPDGSELALGGYDQSVWIINAETGTEITRLYGHRSVVTSVTWNADGTRLFSGSGNDGRILVWDMVNYTVLQDLEIGFNPTIVLSPDGEQVAVGASGLTLLSTTANTWTQQVASILPTYSIGAVAWSPDGNQVAIGTETFGGARAARLMIIDSMTGTVVRSVETGQEAIYGLDWNASQNILAVFSADDDLNTSDAGSVTLWDVTTLTRLQTYPANARYASELNFSPFGGRLAYGLTTPSNGDLGSGTIVVQTSNWVVLANGAVQIVVPDPTLERLQSIAELCNAPLTVAEAIPDAAQTDQLSEFIVQVELLTTDSIPPACAADLIAVAEAIQPGE